ncbi:ArsR/SmtB family transcription factor [Mycobacterium asiaticum]|uniref:ArsR/SmtB family transcription factor n=1 Tax=Mycobacterium asiaticum TaxID=1790 RepID=UPI0020A34F22|nr:metalloregulator ArsR/SmtB family transcription factor [Mycobacterium asiaticum]
MASVDRVCDRLFVALANPVRRKLLEILTRQPLCAGELSDRFELSRPAVAEHLKVLREAGLVADEPQGRRRIYRLTAEPLAALGDWLHPFENLCLPGRADVAAPPPENPDQEKTCGQ